MFCVTVHCLCDAMHISSQLYPCLARQLTSVPCLCFASRSKSVAHQRCADQCPCGSVLFTSWQSRREALPGYTFAVQSPAARSMPPLLFMLWPPYRRRDKQRRKLHQYRRYHAAEERWYVHLCHLLNVIFDEQISRVVSVPSVIASAALDPFDLLPCV